MAEDGIAYTDVETLGTRDSHDIFEAALIIDGVEHIFWIEGIDLSNADPDALNLNRYYERFEEGLKLYGIPAKDAAMKIAKLTSRRVLAGSNPKFDEGRLGRLLRQHGLQPAWSYRVIDVPMWAAGALGHKPPISVRKLNEELGIIRDEKIMHTAMEDARWSKNMLERAIAVRDAAGRLRRIEGEISTMLAGLGVADDVLPKLTADWSGRIQTACEWRPEKPTTDQKSAAAPAA